MSSFRPPKMGATPFNPIHEQRSMDMLKRSIAPMAGPLNIPQSSPVAAPSIHPLQANPIQFNKLRAMFAKGR